MGEGCIAGFKRCVKVVGELVYRNGRAIGKQIKRSKNFPILLFLYHGQRLGFFRFLRIVAG